MKINLTFQTKDNYKYEKNNSTHFLGVVKLKKGSISSIKCLFNLEFDELEAGAPKNVS